MRPRRPSTFAARIVPPTVVPRGAFEGEGVRWVPIADAPPEGKGQPSRPRRPVFVCECGEVMTLRPYALSSRGLVTPVFSHDRGELPERVVAEVRRTHSKPAARAKLAKLQAALDELNPNKGCGYRVALKLGRFRGPAWRAGQDWKTDLAPRPGGKFVPPKARYHRDPIDKAHDQALAEDKARR